MDTRDAGRKGGLSKSAKKIEAAKINGLKGGKKLIVKHLPSDFPPSDEALEQVRADLDAKYKGL
jgi:hypothetical protein